MDAHEFTADLSLVSLDEGRGLLGRWTTRRPMTLGARWWLAWGALRRATTRPSRPFFDRGEAARVHAELAALRLQSRYFRGGSRF